MKFLKVISIHKSQQALTYLCIHHYANNMDEIKEMSTTKFMVRPKCSLSFNLVWTKYLSVVQSEDILKITICKVSLIQVYLLNLIFNCHIGPYVILPSGHSRRDFRTVSIFILPTSCTELKGRFTEIKIVWQFFPLPC